jgi:DNA-binding SARP family transcriptional activator
MTTVDIGAFALAPPPTEIRLQLTGEFVLTVGRRLRLTHSAQRLVAYLAIAGRPVSRERLGGALWAEASQARADGNLRSALWRLRQARPFVIERRDETLSIAPRVDVDVAGLRRLAERILDDPGAASIESAKALAAADDLLPGWDEPWLTPERERLRQLRLHALERAAEHFLGEGDFARAIALGLDAVESEPYRESPYRLLVEAHLSEGNASEAARQYLAYRRLAIEELGVRPSDRMEELVEAIRPAIREAATTDA